jgi:phosphate transport system protein
MSTRILFVCIQNACRSQIAEGFARAAAGDDIEAYSAGSSPAGAVNPGAVEVMKEIGIDISAAESKHFDNLPVREFDIVVGLGCGDQCPIVPAKERIDWDIEDPAEKPLEVFRSVRDKIGRRVGDLLGVPVPGANGETRGMMERHFDEELRDLKNDLLKMAAMVEEAIHKSMEALTNRDLKLADSVIESDARIDEREVQIEEAAIDLLARRQPVAIDLRAITTGMKINADLERIADLAVNIAQVVVYDLADQPLLKPLVDMPKLAGVAKKMLKGAIDAFVNRDEGLAKEVILNDEQADDLRNEIQRELIDDFMAKDGSTAPRAVPLLLVARHLERICDHATNIAEDVIYMVEAEIVRHHPEKLDDVESDGESE